MIPKHRFITKIFVDKGHFTNITAPCNETYLLLHFFASPLMVLSIYSSDNIHMNIYILIYTCLHIHTHFWNWEIPVESAQYLSVMDRSFYRYWKKIEEKHSFLQIR